MNELKEQFKKGINIFIPSMICNTDMQFSYNVLVNLDGTLSPMPFDTGTTGLWYFDGQVFYQKKEV